MILWGVRILPTTHLCSNQFNKPRSYAQRSVKAEHHDPLLACFSYPCGSPAAARSAPPLFLPQPLRSCHFLSIKPCSIHPLSSSKNKTDFSPTCAPSK